MRLIQFKTRKEWLTARESGVGGSDVPAILGLSKWASEFSLWSRKVGIGEEQVESDAMRWGHILEPHVIAELERETGVPIQHIDNAIVRHPDHPELFCSPDGLTVEDRPRLVEVKTTNAFKSSEWDEGVPELYWHQVQHSLMCCRREKALVAVLIGGQVFRWCEVERDPDWEGENTPALLEFVRRVVEEDPPSVTGHEADSDTLLTMFPEENPGAIVALSADFLDVHHDLLRVNDEIKALVKKKNSLRNEIKDAIGNAHYGQLPGGLGLYRWQAQHRKAHMTKASDSRVLTYVKNVKET